MELLKIACGRLWLLEDRVQYEVSVGILESKKECTNNGK